MKPQWYNDSAAQHLHQIMQEKLREIMAELLPDYELTHLGINRSIYTDEVKLVLHFNPFGSVRVVPDREEIINKKLLK